MTATHPLRTIGAHERDAWARAVTTTYGQDWREGGLRNAAVSLDPRAHARRLRRRGDRRRRVDLRRVMTVPGALTPVAGITLVAVLPAHRRRGILTAMMRRQFTDLYESGGEPIAALNAADATIYGRFGYGLVSHVAEIQGDKRLMALRPGTGFGDGTVRLLGRQEARPLPEKVYDTARLAGVGWVDRTEKLWQARLADGGSVTGERTRARPDLLLTSAELGAAYLVGTTLSSLASADRVEDLRPGAVAVASLGCRGERAPFHPSGWAFPAF
ncbi:GNAT family N-acetyltransferase [Nonomuraea gerenzanensis]|uniref:Enhanced intracellular survival protein n=1 Tax=Nonomuraea gerenzanensis TaxID=93944 RepID=A0A1M4EM78_9ACTN|nr:GNAT family N-acetyltransferase [Nonomuraea gerenzanensis]UBU11470.1 GNAT family N-acetyltransferase [Nonomuraea gerenzanensis]SBO99956.1 Enhanced intracellular survival protein [Nonomuraea gerenzanensis]